MEQILAEYRLPASKIEVYNDRVIFTHKGIGPITNASHICGTKIVYIQDITSVEFKEPTFFSSGYLQVNFAGKTFKGDPITLGDEYSIPVALKKYVPSAKVVWECINRLVSDFKNNVQKAGSETIVQSFSLGIGASSSILGILPYLLLCYWLYKSYKTEIETE